MFTVHCSPSVQDRNSLYSVCIFPANDCRTFLRFIWNILSKFIQFLSLFLVYRFEWISIFPHSTPSSAQPFVVVCECGWRERIVRFLLFISYHHSIFFDWIISFLFLLLSFEPIIVVEDAYSLRATSKFFRSFFKLFGTDGTFSLILQCLQWAELV